VLSPHGYNPDFTVEIGSPYYYAANNSPLDFERERVAMADKGAVSTPISAPKIDS
jgi:urease beta subunit